MHKLLSHINLAQYSELLEAMIHYSPNELLVADKAGNLPCEIVASFSDSKAYKFKLLTMMVNAGAKGLSDIKIFNYKGDDEIIIKAAALGLKATEQELKTHKYDYNKKDEVTGEDLLHLCAKSSDIADRNLLKLALNSLKERIERSEEHTSELQSHHDLVFRLLLEKKKKKET